MVKVRIDTAAASAALDSMDQKFKDRVALAAIDAAAKKTQSIAKLTILSAGLAGGQDKTKNGWSWTVIGRIARSVVLSRKWSRGKNIVGRKVFNTRASRRLASERAPHAHLIIRGHRKFIPTGAPGKGQVRRGNPPSQPARPLYAAAELSAPAILKAESIKAVRLAIRRINRKRGRL